MKKLLYVLTGLCLLAGLFAGCEKEEKAKSTIKGVITDKETGNPLSGVTLELQPSGKQVQTAEDGTYAIENLKAGAYTLKAERDGYDDYENAEIQLGVEQTLTLNIEMEDEYKAESDYTITRLSLNMDMVYVSGGAFEMGATAEQGDDAPDWEKPVRAIKLDSYHIGKYEVTQAQWKVVMGNDVQGYSYFYGKGDAYPVYYVSWDDAQEFCRKLSQMTGKTYRLPTEAQWEYAARGGNKSQHYKYAGSNDISEVAWYADNSNSETHPVGTKKANELGIYDMSGNVWEWCLDWYDSYSSSPEVNPQGPATGSDRVFRGGSWKHDVGLRVSSRYGLNPDGRGGDLGFRVVCIAE